MNNESKRQELASRLVQREVFYCVSSLVGTLSTLVQNVPYEVQRSEGISWEEDILPLMESTNYEEAVCSYVDEADADELEALIENDGYWSDFLDEKVYPKLGRPPKVPAWVPDKVCVECHTAIQSDSKDWADYNAYHNTSDERTAEVEESVKEFDGREYCGEQYDDEFGTHRCDCCGTWLAGARYTYEKPDDMEEQSIDDWLKADSDRSKDFRALVFDFLSENSDMQELCDKYSIDTDDYHDETYEFWLVSDWLAAKLKARGYVTGELCGLTIYARGCTGQSMCLDHNMQEIALELWGDDE